MKNKSAFERLSAMDELFSMNDLAREYPEISKDSLSVLVGRWNKSNMINLVGPRTGLYYNLVKNPKASSELKTQAVQRLFPSAVLIGATALLEHEWVTQDQKTPDIAVITESGRPPKVYGVNLVHRPAMWYKQVEMSEDISSTGLPMVQPEYAIADAVKYKETWLPDPDDLYLPNDTRCYKAIDIACQALKVNSPFESNENTLSDLGFSDDNGGFKFG